MDLSDTPSSTLTAHSGSCAVTRLPHREIVITAAGRFLVVNEQEAADLERALHEFRTQLQGLQA